MARRWLSASLIIVMSGCGQSPGGTANENSPVVQVGSPEGDAQANAPAEDNGGVADPASLRPGQAGALPDDRRPIAEGAIDPKSAQGAGLVVQRYAGLLEQGKYAEARALWSDGGKASGLTEKEFVESFDRYGKIHAEIGKPGELEGAAGSIFVEVPLRLYGTLKNGKPFNQIGTIALRRVNDVPGSSAESRDWHIHSVELH